MSWAVTFPALEPLVKPAISTIEDKQGICSHKVGDAGLEKVARRYARDSAYVHGTMFGQSQKIFDLSQNRTWFDPKSMTRRTISCTTSVSTTRRPVPRTLTWRSVFPASSFHRERFAIHYQLQDPLGQQAKLTSDSHPYPNQSERALSRPRLLFVSLAGPPSCPNLDVHSTFARSCSEARQRAEKEVRGSRHRREGR